LAVGGLRVLLGHRFEIGDSVLFDSSHQEIDLKQECLYGSYFLSRKVPKGFSRTMRLPALKKQQNSEL
jgi:hypothetical protein